MLKHLFATLLAFLVVVGSASGEKIKFKNGELITDYLGSNPCTTTTYGANGEVGMATICAAKPDSSIGKRTGTSATRQHVIGQGTNLWAADTSRVLIKMDISLVPDAAKVTGANLYLPIGGVAGNCVAYCYARCAPLCSRRPWNPASYAGVGLLWKFAETDTAPTWTDYKYWPGGGGDSLWTDYGCDSTRTIDWDPGDKADRWKVVEAVYGAYSGGTLNFDITRAVQMDLADSTIDITNCGFLLWIDEEATANTAIKACDHWTSTAAYRPYMVIEYIDTTHVESIPVRLGSAGLSPPLTYQQQNTRETFGRFAFFSDTHACSAGCGGIGPEDGWRLPRKLAVEIVKWNDGHHPIDAVFMGGDYCVNSVTGQTSVDSMAAILSVFDDAGIPHYATLGNWEGWDGSTPNIFAYAQGKYRLWPELYGERYYTVDLGFMRAVVLNDNTGFNCGCTAEAYAGCTDDSLSSRFSQQWSWLQRTINNSRDGQPIAIFAHKPPFGSAYPMHRQSLRDCASGTYTAIAESLMASTQDEDVFAWFLGHVHGASSTPPMHMNLTNDSVYTRTMTSAGNPAVATLTNADTAAVYICGAVTYTETSPNAAIISRGQVRRWANDWGPHYYLVDVMGDWWKMQAIDTSGTVLDTLIVRRRD